MDACADTPLVVSVDAAGCRIDEDGDVIGRIRPTGIRPKSADRLKANGFSLPASMFSDLHAATA